MTVSGRPFDLQPSCVESTTRELHLLFKYGVLPPVSLIRLGRLDVMSAGDAATLHTAQGVVNVGGQDSFVQRTGPVAVSIRRSAVESPGFVFATSRGAPGPSIALTATDVDSVRINRGAELVRTEFDRHRAILYLLIGIIAGMLASTAVEIVTRRAVS
jgi:hypothetical protein